jgi:GAF domain-containing protein
MGIKLLEFYSQADGIGGLRAKIRLAQLTRMTSTQAEAAQDSPDAIARFQTSIEKLRQEFGGGSAGTTGEHTVRAVANDDGTRVVERLRRHHRLVADLLAQRSLFIGEVQKTVERATEAASSALECERASVWFIDEGRTKIRCVDLFERGPAKHSSGIELFAKDFPSYFKALEAERTIAAHDAHTDGRTSCFSAPYLKPLGINSMLDVPIWANGRMQGVVCHEHVGPKRTWNPDDETFAYMMGNLVALAIENSKRPGTI